MSDLGIYELEDIVWEFGDNDDHIVPHPGGKKSGFSVENDSSKKPRLELRCTETNSDSRSASNGVLQRMQETSISALKEEKGNILDMSPWTNLSSGGFLASLDGDSNRKDPCSTSDEERTLDHCMENSSMDPPSNGLCDDDAMLDDRAASVENNLYQYELNDATHTDHDLDLFGNNLGDKECNDLFYGWTDIENFEDVDRMFRSCDSTFGLDIDNNDELGWFPSSHAIERSNDTTKPSFNFPICGASGLDSVTEQQEVYGLNNGIADESDNKKHKPVNCNSVSQKLIANGPSTVMNPDYMNGSSVGSGIDSESQILSHVSEPEYQKLSKAKRKEHPSDNGVSLIHFCNLKQASESNHSLSFQCSFSSETHQQEASDRPCIQMPITLVNPNSGHSSSQVLPSMTSCIIKSEDSGIPSLSPRESSYASIQMQSVENAHEASLQNASVSQNKNKDRQHQDRLAGHSEKGSFMVHKSNSDPVCPKKLSEFGNDVDEQSEVDCDVGIATDLDSSNIQEGSCMSSVLDEVLIDASSFQQLQDVVEKLDIRTKLCIRDSLYRLARSAERRHKCDKPSSDNKDDKDTSGALLSDGTNKSTDFMDMETNTNPIDRSIAHLLFHRPSDPSATALFDTLPVKPHTMGQARDHGPLMAEKPGSQEETSSAIGEVVDH